MPTEPVRGLPWAGPWQCPLCGAPLRPDDPEGTLRCPAGHCFDRAKEGYWHLLPVQEMHSRTPGDSREMVAARHAFLNAGYYGVFGRALAGLAVGKFRPAQTGAAVRILDAGCGEGWYDRMVLPALHEARIPAALAGFDIAKPAVRLAAKALPEARYAVASSFRQPVESGWADVLLNIFSPLALAEFRRVLRPGGLLVYAVPGPRHLFGMKQVLYDQPYENPVRDIAYEGFRAVGECAAQDTITVPREMRQALFAMTPYYWKTPADGAARLLAPDILTTEIAFRFLLFEKE